MTALEATQIMVNAKLQHVWSYSGIESEICAAASQEKNYLSKEILMDKATRERLASDGFSFVKGKWTTIDGDRYYISTWLSWPATTKNIKITDHENRSL